MSRTPKRAVRIALCLALGSTLAQPIARAVGQPAGSAANETGSDEVVIQVGGESMTLRAVERRVAQMPAVQRRTLGRTPDEIKTAFVQNVLVPALLRLAGVEQLGNQDVLHEGGLDLELLYAS